MHALKPKTNQTQMKETRLKRLRNNTRKQPAVFRNSQRNKACQSWAILTAAMLPPSSVPRSKSTALFEPDAKLCLQF